MSADARLPYVQLEAQFKQGNLADDVLVLVDGDPVGKIPTTSLALSVDTAKHLVWRLETIGDLDDEAVQTFRTLQLQPIGGRKPRRYLGDQPIKEN